MKTMLQKLQTLGQKAAHIAQVVEQAPGKIAQARETIQLTAGQLQMARSELQQVATGLHVENDEDFSNAFREVAENADVFQEAGYDLAGVDLEVSHFQRLIVHLDRHTEVPEHSLRYLLTQNSSKVTVSSIISSIIKAEALAQQVHSPDMEYRGLLIHLGATPGVRILWREIVQQIAAAAPIQIHAPQPAVKPAPIAVSPSAFGQSSYFESTSQRMNIPAPAPAAVPGESIHLAPAAETHRSQFSSSKSLQGDWKKDAMERLKNSPGVSKYKR